MNCPKCNGSMETVRFEQIEVDRCQACGGLWFDLLEHEHLKKLKGSEAIDTGDPAAGKRQDEKRKINCPRCSTQMISMVFPDQPHIHYEMCSVCDGLYLDAGEFKDFKENTLAERIRHAFGPFLKGS